MLVFACVGASLGCDRKGSRVPERPAAVPASAEWAGGVDGGHWFLCTPTDVRRMALACWIFNDQTGDTLAEGTFVVRRARRADPAGRQELPFTALPPTARPDTLRYDYYDGDVIWLAPSGDRFVLAPEGVVRWPFGPGQGGKRAVYKDGVMQGEPVQY